MGDETVERLPENKGVVHRVRFRHGEDSAIRTEVRSMMHTRIFVDLKPLGAVLLLLETARQKVAPRRLVAWTGDRAGEYAEGAIEAAWGAILLEGAGGGGFMGLRFPGDPRRLHLHDVIGLAETVL